MTLEIIILAAGQGKRMYSKVPKVLHTIGDRSLLEHVCKTAQKLIPKKISVVYGHGGEQVLKAMSHLDVIWVEQAEQLGTGHAVSQVASSIDNHSMVLVLYGDVPLITSETLRRLLSLGESSKRLNLLTVNMPDPTGYGRIIRTENGQVTSIIEEKDATLEQKTLREVNTGILCTTGKLLKGWLTRLRNDNQQSEYYLTDIVAMAAAENIPINTTLPAVVEEVLGVNNRQQLADLERCYQFRQAEILMEKGVTLRDPARFDLRGEIISLGLDVELDVNVVLEGTVSLGDAVRIGPNVIIKNSHIGDYTEILANSIIEDATIGARCRIGPFARIRPETILAEQVHIGNFVEIKKSKIDTGSKVNHLSYIGDTRMGSGVNIGAGTITCNYDGVNKHQTIIEDGAFIGSDTQLIAPVTVEKNATIGAGSTITRTVPEDALTLSRVEQKTYTGWKRPVKKDK